MKVYKLIILFLLMLFNTVVLANAQSANELTELLSRYKTFQAHFKQSTFVDNNQRPELSYGRLYMERPGKFRWEVNKPMKQIIVANGDLLWIYDVELQQVTKQRLQKNQLNNPAVLLSGDVSALLKQYAVSKVNLNGKTWYELKPHSPQSSFVLVRMHFSRYQLSAIWVKNNLGQVSLFEFSHIKLNARLNPALFNFKPPPGVDVLK